MRILLIALIALNFISGKNPTPAQTQMRDTNAKIKAVFLYNFTKYIEWPEGKREGNFVIGVLGQSPVFSELANSAHKNNEKPSAVRYLDIKSCNDVNSIAECHMLYIPNGSSEMLKRMNRGYTREWYLNRIEAIKSIIPDAAISTDIITGFCGETDEEHQETISLMKEVGYDFSYMFFYSERPKTLAER